jgi:dihydroneopterin aldolase
MNIISRMSLGVTDYCFSTKTACVEDPKKSCRVSLSLRLWGEFWPAALNDQINDTIDYEALCNDIAKYCDHLSCATIDLFEKRLQYAISQFSPIISQAYFSITITCHASFTCEASFAIGPTLQSDHE